MPAIGGVWLEAVREYRELRATLTVPALTDRIAAALRAWDEDPTNTARGGEWYTLSADDIASLVARSIVGVATNPPMIMKAGACRCGHVMSKHVYNEGPCRPGFRCSCTRYRDAASCPHCGCIGYHSEVCEGFEINDPARAR